MTAANNALLYNAVLEGVLAGVISGRPLTAKNTGTPPAIGTADASYSAIVGQATDIAVAIDALIPTDDTASPQPAGTQPISVITTGVAIVPSTGAIQYGQIGKSRLLSAAVMGFMEGRNYGQNGSVAILPSVDLTALATIISANYEFFATALAQPHSSPVINNQLIYQAAYNAFLAGSLLKNPSTFSNDAVTVEIAGTASELALAVDALIPFDATISASSSNGAALAPSTDVIQQTQFGKFRLIYSIVLAYYEGRNTLSNQLTNSALIAAWVATQGPNIAAMYNASVGNIFVSGAAVKNNPLLWNEAYCGFIAGNLAGRPTTSTSNTDTAYEAIAAAAVAFANEVDTTVGAPDVVGTPVPTGTQPISNAEGAGALPPTTGTIQEGELGKTGLMWAICRAQIHGRPLLNNTLDTTASTYSALAQSIVALYLVSALALTTP